MWSLRMWIATFGLDSASLLHTKNHLSIRPAVYNQNVTIHIRSDHIVRQTILFSPYIIRTISSRQVMRMKKKYQ